MRILVDMDDTIERMLTAWIKRLNDRYGTSVTYDDIVDWDVSRAFPELTREQVYGIEHEPGFWRTVEPIEGAPEALKRFIDAGHEVYIVTATEYSTLAEKMDDLLFKYFPFITWDHVIITSHKQMIRGDVLIDDAVHNLEGGDYAKVLFTSANNKLYDAEANGMSRANNWAEAEAIIERLAAGLE